MGGSYEIIDYLGRGAMGFVYRARHNILDREYALKTLGADQISENSWRRFQIEAQAIAKMSHSNVVGIHNFALHHSEGKADIPFYVMDLLEGSNLGEKLRDNGTPPLAIVLAIFQQAAAGLGYAHSKGMIHRDVKPGNIVLLNKPDAVGATVKIVDFGIAKLTDGQYGAQKLTTAGEVFGSPMYMSPEQSMGQVLDPRTDIYSLGIALFESLVGDPPFIANSAVEVMMMHQGAPIPIINDVSQVSYPAEVQQVVEKMMAKMPEDRYRSMEQVIADLAAIARGQEPTLGVQRLTDTGRFEHRSAGGGSARGNTDSGNTDTGNTNSGNYASRVGEVNSGPLFSTTQSFTQDSLAAQESDDEPEEKTAKTIKVLSIGLAAVAVVVTVALFLVSRPPDWMVKNNARADKRVSTVDASSGPGVTGKSGASVTTMASPEDNSEGGDFDIGTIDTTGVLAAVKKGSPGSIDFFKSSDNDFKPRADKNSVSSRKLGGEQKPPSGSQNETFKYSSLVEVKGITTRRFQFPNDITIGTFGTFDTETEDLVIEARGPVDLKASLEYMFTPDLIVEKYPQYMKRFCPGDVTSIRLTTLVGHDKVLDAVSIIPTVKKLVIEKDGEFTASSAINSLRRFKSLKVFKATSIGISGTALAEANCWHKLESLFLAEVYDLEPLLKALRNSPDLKQLALEKTRLSSRDIEVISTLTNLRGLNLSDNKISARDLNALSTLPHLVYLNIQGCDIDKIALQELKKFKHLRKLDVFSTDPKQKIDRDALSRELPQVTVH